MVVSSVFGASEASVSAGLAPSVSVVAAAAGAAAAGAAASAGLVPFAFFSLFLLIRDLIFSLSWERAFGASHKICQYAFYPSYFVLCLVDMHDEMI